MMEIEELLSEKLSNPWNYGVAQDGRVFFVNEESQATTWLHPVTKHPVQSGQSSSQDLPRGWEYGYTNEGIPYFIDHINQKTTFQHPETGEQFAVPLSQTEQQIPETQPTQESQFQKKHLDSKRQSTRKKSTKSKVKKALPEPKRNLNSPVSYSGWLHKQESGGLKSWKKRWFVLSDFCLFMYKDSSEKETQAAISLPSYKINPCIKDSNINKKYAFKAEHQNLKTHYFAGENEIDTKTWMNALSLATIAQTDPNIEKQLQTDKEVDEEAGFDTSTDNQQDSSMKRFSSNEMFPPSQSMADPRSGHHNQYYQREPSDSHSQGSSGNRYPLDTSGGSHGQQQQRDPRQQGYPERIPNNQQQQRDSYASQSNMDNRKLTDPYQNQSRQLDRPQPPVQNNSQPDQYDPRRPQQDMRPDPRYSSNQRKNSLDQNSYRSDNSQTNDRFNNQRGLDPRYNSQNQKQNQQFNAGYPGMDRPKPGGKDERYGSMDKGRMEQNQNYAQDQRNSGYSNQMPQQDQRNPGLNNQVPQRDQRNLGYDQRQPQGYMNHQNPSQNISDPQFNREQNQYRHQKVPSGPDPRDHQSRYPSDQRRDPASDPRNTTPRNSQAGYPGPQHGGNMDGYNSSQPRDRMYSERSVDVPTNNSQKSDSVSDEGGFRQDKGRPWKGPNDYRSEPPQRYRDSNNDENVALPQLHQQQYDPRQPQQQHTMLQQAYQPQQQQFSGSGTTPQLQRGHPPRMSSQSSRSTGSAERTPPSDVIKGYAHPFPPVQRGQDPRQTNGFSPPSATHSSRSSTTGQPYQHQQPQHPQQTSTYNQNHYQPSQSNQNTSYGQSPTDRSIGRSNEQLNQQHHRHQQSYRQDQQHGIDGTNRHFEPLTIDTSPIHEPVVQVDVEGTGTPLLQADNSRGPGRPPLPADMMPQYVEELAQTRTPATRKDMLTSMEISMQRKEKERLFFQYPEDEDPMSQRDSRQGSYRRNRPMPGLPGAAPRQQGNNMPGNRYTNEPIKQPYSNQQNQSEPYNQPYNQPYRPGSSERQRGSDMVSGMQPSEHRDQASPQRSGYLSDNYNRQNPAGSQFSVQQSPPSPMSDRQSLGGTINPYAELSTVQRASHTRTTSPPAVKEQLPALPSRPPPRRVTSPPGGGKTAAQEMKQYKRKSGDYSQELQAKEEQRLNKHIAASFKRLSLGTELGMYSEFGVKDDTDKKDMARRSLDWELESSLFGSNLNKYGQENVPEPYGYNSQKFSTPNYSNSYQMQDNNNENINNNISVPSPTGFSQFVKTNPDVTERNNITVHKRYGSQLDEQMTEDSFNPHMMSMAMSSNRDHGYPEKEYYMENDNVAVLDMDENSELNTSKDIMQDIDQDVINIKHRISSLKNLLDTETKRLSPNEILTAQEKNPDIQSSLDSLESYPERFSNYEQLSSRENYGSNEPTERNEQQRSYERQPSFGNQKGSGVILHGRQSSLGSLPSHHQRQTSNERQPSFGNTVRYPQGNDRQNSFGNAPNHVRQSSLGLPPRDYSRQQGANTLSVESKQSSRQSSYTNLVGVQQQKQQQIMPRHSHQASLDGNQLSYDTRPITNQKAKGWKSLGQLDDVPLRETTNSNERQRKEDPWNKSSHPASTLLEWKLSGSPFTGLTKDDTMLLEQSHTERMKDNLIHLQNRPMSYAEGLKPPLTKLEKLEFENKISRSMGAINVQDLEKETNDYLDELGVQRPGYDPEWEAIQKVLKRQEPAMEFPPMGNQYQGDGQRSGPNLPPKSPGVGRRNVMQQPPPTQNFEIGAIKEDPDMPDSDVLEARKLLHIKPSLDAQRLRLSISAGDLIGKSHEELVLLLIQLKRAQSRLEGEHNYYQARLAEIRGGEKQYKLKRKNSVGRLEEALEEEHEQYMNLKRQNEEVEKQLEVHKPLCNLVDNMVTMGSLYGGDNLMLASQYKRHKLRPDQYQEPKEMIEFSRKYQEQKFVKEQEMELKKLTDEEIELEEKLQQLFELDKLLQEKSFSVTNLQENKEHLEKAFDGVKQQEEWETDPREHRKLAHQKKTIEQELTRVRQQLADSSRDLEETAAENAKVEHEVILLRKEVYGQNKNLTSPTLGADNLKTRAKLERELDKVTAIMEGLNKQGAKLQEVMNTLHKPEPTGKANSAKTKSSTYLITDLDSMTTEDMARSPSNPDNNMGDNTRYNSDQSFRDPPHVQRTLDSSNRNYIQSPEQTVPDVSPNYTSTVTWERGNKKFDVNQNSLSDHNNRSPDDQGYFPQNQQYIGQGYSNDGQLQQTGIFSNVKMQVDSSTSQTGRPVTQVDPNQNSPANRPMYSPMDISQADENTKRFFGILPKEKPKGQTLRDVKKREFERKSRERMRNEEGSIDSESEAETYKVSAQALRKRSRSLPRRVSAPWGDPKKEGGAASPSQIKSFDDAVRRPRRKLDPERRKSAIERLFPPGEMPAEKSQSALDLNSEVHVRRMSNIFTPKPFGTPNTKTYSSVKQVGAISGYKSVSMSNPSMSNNENEKMLLHPPSTARNQSLISQSSPQQYLDTSLPREGEPQDVQPEFVKPQVTFAPPQSSSLSGNQPQYYPSRDHQQQMLHRASPVTVATVYPVPNINHKLGYNSNTQFNPGVSQQTRYSSSGTDYPSNNSGNGNANANFLQQFNTWKQNKQNPTATVRPLSSNNNHSTPSGLNNQEPRKKPKSALKTKRGAPRRQTISSSQPMWFESPTEKKGGIASEAGDLISGRNHKVRGLVRAESLQDLKFDDETIDRMVLYTPQKVEIPERYIPDSDDESITEEEKLVRQERSDKMRKLVIAQSFQDWKEDEIIGERGGNIHQSIKVEKQRREHLLDIRQALAKEVTQKSKEVAVNRRKAMSSGVVDSHHYQQYDSSEEQPYLPPRQGRSFYA